MKNRDCRRAEPILFSETKGNLLVQELIDTCGKALN